MQKAAVDILASSPDHGISEDGHRKWWINLEVMFVCQLSVHSHQLRGFPLN